MTNPNPLRTPMIQPADELYRLDLTEPTQERLRQRSERVSPTMRTTVGRPGWRWGRPTVVPPTSSGAPRIFGPSDLEPGRQEESPPTPSIDEVRRRLK